jgi:hypothetical protein
MNEKEIKEIKQMQEDTARAKAWRQRIIAEREAKRMDPEELADIVRHQQAARIYF